MPGTLATGDIEYSVGQTVTGTVIKIGDDFLNLRLPGNVSGRIDRVQMPIEYRQKPLRNLLTRGAKIEAVIERIDSHGHQLQLTFHQVTSDPWDKVQRLLRVGSTVRGQVSGIVAYGAFVDLVAGVSALIPFEEIPGAIYDSVDDVLISGDIIEAQIIDIDEDKREIALSIQRHADFLREFRINARQKADNEAFRNLSRADNEARDISKPRLAGGRGRIQRILLVDNDARFTRPCKKWLAKQGYEVEVAQTGSEGIRIAIERSFDLILLDYKLPSTNGACVARLILDERYNARIAIVTGQLKPPPEEDIRDIQLVAVLSKYAGITGIEELIIDIEQRPDVFRRDRPALQINEETTLLENISSVMQNGNDLTASLEKMLAELRVTTGADAAIVFAIEPETNSPSVLAYSGREPDDTDALSELRYSPVRDVILDDDETIFENQVLRFERRFKYLLRYLWFESCIAIRIGNGKHKRVRHALFLFHGSPDRFTIEHFNQTSLVTKMMALAFKQHALMADRENTWKFSNAGRLQSGLAHEINNHLTDVEASIRNVRNDYVSLQQDPKTTLAQPDFLKDMGESITDAMGAVVSLRHVAESYLGLLRDEAVARLNVNELLKNACGIVDPEARPKVRIKAITNIDAPSVVGFGARLERVFVNLLLNAAQQVKEFIDYDAVVVAIVEHVPGDPRYPVKIRFVDAGPGIHHANYARIFEPGYSTRHDGSGLGLPISRGLIERMGGRLRIEDSIMFVGTSMLVELPAAPIEE